MFYFAFLIPFFVTSWQPMLSAAFSWHITTPPKQCSNLSISIVGSDGQPPYRVLVIPSGPTPFANSVDVRPIIDKTFDGNSTTLSFPLNYPANSHFVAVVSDATGFGTGGTSAETNVEDSNDISCFDAGKQWSHPFVYNVGTDNEITQCKPIRVWWDGSIPHGSTPTFVGVIPGGTSFELPEKNITDVSSQGTGFSWVPNIRGATILLIVGGDDRGMGTAGAAEFAVKLSEDTSCLNNLSPSSTVGTPAGSVATSANASNANSTSGSGASNNGANNGGAGNGGASSSGTKSGGNLNVGVIVGAVVGGVIGAIVLIIVILYCLRQLRKRDYDTSVDAPFSLTAPLTSQPATWNDTIAQYNLERSAPSGTPPEGYYGNGLTHTGSGYGMARGTASVKDPRSRYMGTTNGSGVVRVLDISRPVDSRYGIPASGGNSGLQLPGRLPHVRSDSGIGAYNTSSNMGSGHSTPPVVSSPSHPMHTRAPNDAQLEELEELEELEPPPPFSSP